MSSVPEPDTVTGLIQQFESGNEPARREALHNLAQLGPEAVSASAALIAALKDPDVSLRMEVANTLATIGAPVVTCLLDSYRQDEDVDFRKAIIITLGKIGAAAVAAVPMLTEIEEDDVLGASARAALQQIGSRVPASPAGDFKRMIPLVSLILGLVLLATVGAFLMSSVSQRFIDPKGEIVQDVVFALTLFCAGMGGIIGAYRWGRVGAILGTLGLGLGGTVLGLIAGTFAQAVIGPLVQALR